MDAAAWDDRWDALPTGRVLLAHRAEDWKPSDPRPLHDWAVGEVGMYGERLRREWRYLKAWRDHNCFGTMLYWEATVERR